MFLVGSKFYPTGVLIDEITTIQKVDQHRTYHPFFNGHSKFEPLVSMNSIFIGFQESNIIAGDLQDNGSYLRSDTDWKV